MIVAKMSEEPEKWVICRLCTSEFKVKGHPHPFVSGRYLYPMICIPCAEGMETKIPPRKAPHKDPKTRNWTE